MHQEHPLAIWLRENHVKRQAFADQCGISSNYLSRIIGGKARPSLDLTDRVTAATQGEIDASAWQRLPEQAGV